MIGNVVCELCERTFKLIPGRNLSHMHIEKENLNLSVSAFAALEQHF